MSERSFDVVIIGAGPAGEVAAGRLAEGGLEVAIVERELIGGECSFYACMPSKALLRPAQAVDEARRVPGAAEAVSGDLDVARVLTRRDEVIHDLDDSSQLPWLESRGIALVREHGRLEGERAVRAGDELLRARRAVILGVGSTAAIPPIDGLREAQPWTNREITTAKHVPARLLVLGGGVVGCEMASAWSSLGSKVTLVESGDRLLAKEEDFAATQVADALGEAGVDLRIGAKATAVRREDDGGEVTLVLEDGTELTGDELLCAIGRRPLTDDLGLSSIGLQDGGYVEVGETLTVAGHDWLYVVGDANGRALLTHMGKYQARVASDRILGADVRLRTMLDGFRSPRVTFTDPEVGAVGYTLAAAREAGLPVRAVDTGTSANAGGSFYGHDAPGTTRFVVDTERNVLVGATITGAEVQDMLHAATIAIAGEISLDDLYHAVPAFPTRSELWLPLLPTVGTPAES